MSEELNEKIKAELERRGLSERAASERAGLSETALNYILSKPERNPRPDTCRKIAQFFNWDEDEILADRSAWSAIAAYGGRIQHRFRRLEAPKRGDGTSVSGPGR